jgi:hypothetical protein
LRYPRISIAQDFGYVARHIIVEAYNAYCAPAEERPCWDLATALYAVCPERGYFGLSQPGRVVVDDEGVTTFVRDPAGNQRYLTMDVVQQARVLEALVQLTSQPADLSGLGEVPWYPAWNDGIRSRKWESGKWEVGSRK